MNKNLLLAIFTFGILFSSEAATVSTKPIRDDQRIGYRKAQNIPTRIIVVSPDSSKSENYNTYAPVPFYYNQNIPRNTLTNKYDEITMLNSEKYINVNTKRIEGETLIIEHSKGISSISFRVLPDSIKEDIGILTDKQLQVIKDQQALKAKDREERERIDRETKTKMEQENRKKQNKIEQARIEKEQEMWKQEKLEEERLEIIRQEEKQKKDKEEAIRGMEEEAIRDREAARQSIIAIIIFVFSLVFSIAIYLVPTIISLIKKRHNTPAIIALNIFLGWTLLGWVGALVWSLTEVSSRKCAK